MKNQKKYKAAVIGCGKIGAEEWSYSADAKPATHAASFLSHEKIELAGLCDKNYKKVKTAEKFFPGVSGYISAEKMLGEIRPDIVSVATNPETHFEFVKIAADFGAKAIICEKPMASSEKDAEEMIKYCKKKKCLLFINHSRHFDFLTLAWQKKVEKGILGKIMQANCLYHNGFFNNGTHAADFLGMFLGEAEKISGIYNNFTTNPKKGKNIDAIIFYKNGARAVLQSTPQNSRLTEWSFYGEKSNLYFKELGLEINYKNLKIGKKRSLMAQMASHVVLCLDGRQKPKSTGEDGMIALKIVLAAERSAKNNGKIVKI